MANFNSIKQEIDQNVNTNGQQLITGAILNETLKDMIDEVDSKKQDTLVAGSGINISGNVISATGGSGQTLSANPPLDINNDTIILNYGTGIKIGEGEALEADFDYVQEKLDSGVNIKTINGNSLLGSGDITISGGNGLWQSGSGTDSLVAPVSANAGLTASGDGALIAARGGSSATGRTSASFGLDNKATGDNSFAAGNHNEARGANSTVIGHGLYARNTDEVALGQYNSSHVSTSGQPWATKFSIGNGNSFINPSNVVEVRDNGKVFVNGIGGYAGSSSDNASNSLQEVVNGKQDTLVSGQNIKTINGNTILGSGDLVISGGQTYTAGDFINITSGVISVDSNNLAGNGLTTDSNGALEVDSSVVATQADLSGYLRNDDSGTIQNQDGTGDTSLTIIDGDSEDYVKLVAYDTPGVSPHIEIFENGSGDTKFFYDHLERGTQVSIDYPSTSGTLALTSDLAGKQDALTAGDGINIDANDVISSTTFKNGTGTSSIMSVNAANANGTDSVAIGKGCTAGILLNQNGCVSLGYYASAQHSGEVALGKYNKYTNTGTDAEKTQFTIGNGTDNANRSNYFEIKMNGDAYLNGIGGYTGTNTSSSTTLQDTINGKQDTLTAGSGISIQNNVISATGGGGGGLSAGTGIFIANNTINVDTYGLSGDGIDNTNDEFNVKLGAGLGFDNNGAVASTTFVNDSGYGSIKAVNATSAGTEGLAAGHQSSAGNYGVALGWIADASGSYSTAIGCSNTALGDRATALGSYSDANGLDSISLGYNTVSNGDHETSLGLFNKSYSGNNDNSVDTVFEIGNGTNSTTGRKNVLEIKKNNDTYLYGVGGFDGTNSAAAQTLQDVINNSSSSYSAGNGIDITSGVISVDASDLDGNGLTVDGNGALAVDTTVVATQTDLSGKQDTLTAGSNISISGSTISATDTTYSAGSGLNLNGTTFSVDTTTIQEKLTAGTGISISGNTISATGGAGTAYTAGAGINIDANNEISNTAPGLWTSGTGNMSLLSPSAKTYGNANGTYAVSAGTDTKAEGASSFAIGAGCKTYGSQSFAGGNNAETNSSANISFAFGQNAKAKSANSFVVGSYASVESNSNYSVAIGNNAISSAQNTYAFGLATRAKNTNEIAFGPFNNSINTGTTAEKTSYTIGNGTADNARSNLIEAKQNNDIYVIGVGGFDGTNAGASGVETLQDAIANAGGGGAGNYLPLEGGTLQEDPNNSSYTTLYVNSPNNMGTVEIYSEDDGLGDSISYVEINDTYGSTKYTSEGIETGGVKLTWPSAQNDGYLVSNEDLAGYLPLAGGTIQYDDPSSSDTDLSIISPNSASSIFFNAHEDDPGNTNEGYATMTITDEDANGNSHTAVYTSTGITDGNYTIAFPTLSGDDTFALLSDIQGGGFSAGSGIDITGSTISVDETYLDSVYLPILGGTLENTQNHTDLKIAAPHLESTAYADIMVNATTGTPYIELFSETSVSDDAESFKINGLGNFELEYVNGTSDIIELPHSAGTIALTNQLKWAPGTGNNSMVSAGGVASGLATATNTGSISAGYDTDATGLYSAAFGGQALASGDYSFAASNGSASGDYSASFGTSGSSADYAFSAGNGSTAAAISSIALGRGVHTTSGNTGEGALGIYNYSEAGLVFSIGCGTADNARENAVAIDASGKIFIKGVGGYTGTSTTGATDLATFLNSL